MRNSLRVLNRFVACLAPAGRKMVLCLALLALTAVPTPARAHGGNNNPQAVHACVNDKTNVVRVVGVSGSCTSLETPLHWAIKGPQGAPGVDGTNGTNGLNGSDGTSVTLVDSFSGNQNGCPNGGLILAVGTPPVHAFVCNGRDATRADGPCLNNTDRYVDCGNGTVTDTLTGLIWLRDVHCLGRLDWAGANHAAASLQSPDCGLTDGSVAGDWRLPTKSEWSEVYVQAKALGCVAGRPTATGITSIMLTNIRGTLCYGDDPLLIFGRSGFLLEFWSSTSAGYSVGPHGFAEAWAANIEFGVMLPFRKTELQPIWPVRGSSR
jgi:hypothetical protein